MVGIRNITLHPNKVLSLVTKLSARMTGRCEGEKGLGKGGAKSHCKVLRANIQGVTKPPNPFMTRRERMKYLAAENLERCKNRRKIQKDEKLNKLLAGLTITQDGVLPKNQAVLLPNKSEMAAEKDNKNKIRKLNKLLAGLTITQDGVLPQEL